MAMPALVLLGIIMVATFWVIGIFGSLITYKNPRIERYDHKLAEKFRWCIGLCVFCPVILAVILLISFVQGWIRLV